MLVWMIFYIILINTCIKISTCMISVRFSYIYLNLFRAILRRPDAFVFVYDEPD
ncbi:hypothetical protein Lalb_Chr19g0133411 [Lupinus albus]|uniref:Uncharacterized protein n=1 Tax=Lupinus albus TaxID=3870 RepID=A0A6A4NGN7_LUPAL|nr:hypothetical protein Lalb_Chr19g0133411 [Lupinus albus]